MFLLVLATFFLALQGTQDDPCLEIKTPCSCIGDCGWSSYTDTGEADAACRTGSTTSCAEMEMYGCDDLSSCVTDDGEAPSSCNAPGTCACETPLIEIIQDNCCYCGKEGTVTSDDSTTSTDSTTDSDTTESSVCVDYTLENGDPWRDNPTDTQYNCLWYSAETQYCTIYASFTYESMNAATACCGCGGGYYVEQGLEEPTPDTETSSTTGSTTSTSEEVCAFNTDYEADMGQEKWEIWGSSIYSESVCENINNESECETVIYCVWNSEASDCSAEISSAVSEAYNACDEEINQVNEDCAASLEDCTSDCTTETCVCETTECGSDECVDFITTCEVCDECESCEVCDSCTCTEDDCTYYFPECDECEVCTTPEPVECEVCDLCTTPEVEECEVCEECTTPPPVECEACVTPEPVECEVCELCTTPEVEECEVCEVCETCTCGETECDSFITAAEADCEVQVEAAIASCEVCEVCETCDETACASFVEDAEATCDQTVADAIAAEQATCDTSLSEASTSCQESLDVATSTCQDTIDFVQGNCDAATDALQTQVDECEATLEALTQTTTGAPEVQRFETCETGGWQFGKAVTALEQAGYSDVDLCYAMQDDGTYVYLIRDADDGLLYNTCIAYSEARLDYCDSSLYLCAGTEPNTYGYGNQQGANLARAMNRNDYKVDNCPDLAETCIPFDSWYQEKVMEITGYDQHTANQLCYGKDTHNRFVTKDGPRETCVGFGTYQDMCPADRDFLCSITRDGYPYYGYASHMAMSLGFALDPNNPNFPVHPACPFNYDWQ